MVSEKTDDGYSGVNFDRPAFQEMMDEIRSGKVNCVVVKDLSRFGRNYIEAGNYIERLAWIDVYKAYQNITEISRKLVVDLIEQIRIFEGGRIEIKWRYYDEYQKITGSISKSQMVV